MQWTEERNWTYATRWTFIPYPIETLDLQGPLGLESWITGERDHGPMTDTIVMDFSIR